LYELLYTNVIGCDSLFIGHWQEEEWIVDMGEGERFSKRIDRRPLVDLAIFAPFVEHSGIATILTPVNRSVSKTGEVLVGGERMPAVGARVDQFASYRPA
jgi:hypothetical protein